jgi:hypothetical protein
MIGDFNPLGGWWKMSNYSKWYHYLWLMPTLAIIWVFLWITRKFEK